jgi:hypothetical protein
MSQATDIQPDLTGIRTVPVGANTRLRRGVSTKGVPNLVATLPAGSYPAFEQCSGEEVTLTDGARNFWWVRITALGFTGWVSAVAVLEGGNDEPIANVPQVPTVNL